MGVVKILLCLFVSESRGVVSVTSKKTAINEYRYDWICSRGRRERLVQDFCSSSHCGQVVFEDSVIWDKGIVFHPSVNLEVHLGLWLTRLMMWRVPLSRMGW
jgi:hypothetical protein